MSKITRDDIQRIGDEGTLLHFLEEKLNLPISDGTTLARIALPLPLPFLGLDEALNEQIIDCQDFSGLSQDALGERRPFLIRFKHQSGYIELLRQIAESLHQKKTNPADLFFLCADEHFQPFALAHFKNSESADWNTAALHIHIWTQGNTHIYSTSSEHDLSVLFSPMKSPKARDDILKIKNTSSDHRGKLNPTENLLIKIQKTGTPLRQYGNNIHTGITPGYTRAFEIDEFTCEQFLDEDPKSIEVIKELLKPRKWEGELGHLICIPSSKNKRWPWSGIRDKSEAERIFKETYPAISRHMSYHRNRLEEREAYKTGSAVFYWELPTYGFYAGLKRPKIFYPPVTSSMQASYDTSEKILLSAAFFTTTDLSLLAILNSKLFAWYTHSEYWEEKFKHLQLSKKNMNKAPIAPRTERQKKELSHLAQQILDAPNSPNVPNLEEEINTLIYDLYDLTPAEIALIEE